jgi:hypothetical protein
MIMTQIDFIEEAKKIVANSQAAGLTLRVLGAVAFRIHCPEYVDIHIAMQRELSDIDFAAYTKEEVNIEKFFQNGNYHTERQRAALTPGLFEGRQIYENHETGLHVDIFLDQLNMCHVINFRKRLNIDPITIPLAELTLEKLQIIRINEKDIKDMLMLFAAHPVGDHDNETINGKLIADIMSKDWGFYYTTTLNLDKIHKGVERYKQFFTQQDLENIESRVIALKEMIETAPKSLKWKARAKVGTRVQWYNDVEEVERADHLKDIG